MIPGVVPRKKLAVELTQSRFFIALLPPPEVQAYANRVKQHFAEVYNSRAAQKSPPHVTLQPPFLWNPENLPSLAAELENFAQTQAPLPMTLDGFAAFPPRVIYLDVVRSEPLLTMQRELLLHLERTLGIFDQKARNRAFKPHLTVAFRDLNRKNFRLAWQEYQHREANFSFTIPQLTLLLHNGKRWQVHREFAFTG